MYGHFADKEDSQLESVIWSWMMSLETSWHAGMQTLLLTHSCHYPDRFQVR